MSPPKPEEPARDPRRTHGLARWPHRLWLIALNRPFTLPLGLAAIIVGLLALRYGAGVSAALSAITPETVAPKGTITRFWGALQLIGGMQVLRGVLVPRLETERGGWSIVIAAHVFYSVGLIGGLGLAGSAAGTYMAALAIGATLRSIGLKRIQDTAREVARSREDH